MVGRGVLVRFLWPQQNTWHPNSWSKVLFLLMILEIRVHSQLSLCLKNYDRRAWWRRAVQFMTARKQGRLERTWRWRLKGHIASEIMPPWPKQTHSDVFLIIYSSIELLGLNQCAWQPRFTQTQRAFIILLNKLLDNINQPTFLYQEYWQWKGRINHNVRKFQDWV